MSFIKPSSSPTPYERRREAMSLPPRHRGALQSRPSTMSLNPKPVAHSMIPKPTPITLETLRAHRKAQSQTSDETKGQTLYDILEVGPTTSEEELRRAFKGLQQRFNPKGLAVYGLYSQTQAEALLEHIQFAYDVLVNPSTRHVYDQEIFPQGTPPPREASSKRLASPQRHQPLASSARVSQMIGNSQVTGVVIRRVREHFQISLEALYDRTKINIRTLQMIERDDYQALPAEVYVKGFIKQICQALNIHEAKGVEDYIHEYQSARSSQIRRS